MAVSVKQKGSSTAKVVDQPKTVESPSKELHPHSLAAHSDVTITNPVTGQVLKYVDGIWVNATMAAVSITDGMITNWNTAYGWGNHALAGYLTAETDPVFTASPSSGITALMISNWNTAYGWGNHAGLYVGLTGDQNVAGIKTFTSPLTYSEGTAKLVARKWTNDTTYTALYLGNVTPGNSNYTLLVNPSGSQTLINASSELVLVISGGGIGKLTTTGLGLGLGSGTPAVRLHVVSTTEQMRIGQDLTKYYSVFVKASGNLLASLNGTKFLHTGESTTSFYAGFDAGSVSATGQNNVVVGPGSGQSLSTAQRNVYAGTNIAGGNVNGNVLIGYAAHVDNALAGNNVIVGFECTQGNATPFNSSIIVGNQAGKPIVSGGAVSATVLVLSHTNTTRPLVFGDFTNKRLGVNVTYTSLRSELQVGTAGNLFSSVTGSHFHIGRNVWTDGTNYKRSLALNPAQFIYFAESGAIEFYAAADIGNTVDSNITISRRFVISSTGAVTYETATATDASFTIKSGRTTAANTLYASLSFQDGSSAFVSGLQTGSMTAAADQTYLRFRNLSAGVIVNHLQIEGDSLKFGYAGSKMAFFGGAPVARQAAIADAVVGTEIATINAILGVMRAYNSIPV